MVVIQNNTYDYIHFDNYRIIPRKELCDWDELSGLIAGSLSFGRGAKVRGGLTSGKVKGFASL